MLSLKGSKHKILFQNAEADINMGFLFNNPRIQEADIYWFQIFGIAIQESIDKNDGLVSIDKIWKTKSCYVELHRNITRQ